MYCAHFAAKRCQSCHWLDKPYQQQLALKQQQLLTLLDTDAEVLNPVASAEAGFRYKAKMVALGTVDEPLLGIINNQAEVVDLSDCPLYPPAFAAAFTLCKAFIQRARLTPYDIVARRGEREPAPYC